jgi:hypothetical protein
MEEVLIPLSQLELDLPAPMGDWEAELRRRGVPVAEDDIGRKAISRRAAGQLIAEARESAARARELAARNDQMLELQRQTILTGIPAALLGYSEDPARELTLNGMQADRDSQPRRRSPVEDALENPGGSVFYPIRPERDGE